MLKSKRERNLEAMKDGARRYGSLTNAEDKIKHTFKDVLGREQIIEAQTVEQAWEFLAELQKIPVGDVKKNFTMMDAPSADANKEHGLDEKHT